MKRKIKIVYVDLVFIGVSLDFLVYFGLKKKQSYLYF